VEHSGEEKYFPHKSKMNAINKNKRAKNMLDLMFSER
jgi:hypothetical protein